MICTFLIVEKNTEIIGIISILYLSHLYLTEIVNANFQSFHLKRYPMLDSSSIVKIKYYLLRGRPYINLPLENSLKR